MIFDCPSITFFNNSLSNIKVESSDFFMKCSLSILLCEFRNITKADHVGLSISFIETFSSNMNILNTSFLTINLLIITYLSRTTINDTNFYDVNKMIFQTNSSIQLQNCVFQSKTQNKLEGPVKNLIICNLF